MSLFGAEVSAVSHVSFEKREVDVAALRLAVAVVGRLQAGGQRLSLLSWVCCVPKLKTLYRVCSLRLEVLLKSPYGTKGHPAYGLGGVVLSRVKPKP